MKSKEKALFAASLAKNKKAEDVVILDMRKVSNITDYFVILSASSKKRAQTISDEIEEGLSAKRELIYSIEGRSEANWIVVDSYDVIVHIFEKDIRAFYNLEKLWSDAARVKLCQKKKPLRKTSRRK